MSPSPLRAKESADWSHLLVEAAPNAMIMIDRQRRIVLVNRGAEKLFGFPREDLIGRSIDLLVPERFRDRHRVHVESFFDAPKTRAMGAGRDLYGLRKDGTEVPIEIGLNPIETSEGLVTLASIIDISERKRAEAIQERLATIVESSNDAIISQSLDGVIMSWNRGAERLFGYLAAEALGQSIMMLVPEHLQDDERVVLARVRDGETPSPFETVRRRKDGGDIDVSVQLSPLRWSTGEIAGISQIARDITELKRRDADLKRSNAELEQFAYVASHDLQEPLRMVANYTELLAERYRDRLDEKANKYIHYASDGARRMQRLVTDLLAYSRVGSQGKALTAVNAQEVLKNVMKSLERLIQSSQATIVVSELPVVLADEPQLHQLFQNLVGNAIKFRAESPPVVHVRAVRDGAHYRFSVEDNGIGMDMQYSSRIFQMFQRLHEIGKYDGSGIGLSIAKRIVERHGGSIWVESVLGSGTTFFFTLQRAVRSEL